MMRTIAAAHPSGATLAADRPTLSYVQEAHWLDARDGIAFPHVYAALRLVGPWDMGQVREAVSWVVQRHEILRTHYPLADGHPVPAASASSDDVCRHSGDIGAGDQALREFLRANVTQPMDPTVACGLRACTASSGADEHILLLVLNCLTTDAFSQRVLFRDLATRLLFSGPDQPRTLDPKPLEYSSYAAMERAAFARSGLLTEVRAVAATLTKCGPTELPASQNAGDPQVHERLGSLQASVPATVTRAILARGKQERIHPFIIVFAAFAIWLSRWTERKSFAATVPKALRTHPALLQLIGPFTDSVVVTGEVRDNANFRELLWALRASLPQGDHASSSRLGVLKSVAPAVRAALPRVGFSCTLGQSAEHLAERQAVAQLTAGTRQITLYAIDDVMLPSAATPFALPYDLFVSAQSNAAGELTVRLDYDRSRLHEATVQSRLEQLSRLIAWAAAETPKAPR